MKSVCSKWWLCSCLLVLAACAADSADETPDRSDTADNVDGDTGEPDEALDAGRAATRDASGSDASRRDAGKPVRDADVTNTVRDAGEQTADASAAPVDTNDEESGRLAGMTAAHNKVRDMVETTPPLAGLKWSEELAAYAQEWADTLAKTSCAAPHHRTGAELQKKGYGENLATFSSTGASVGSSAQKAVDGWASEVACWTYGTIAKTEKCDMACSTRLHSDGCGHYTQVIWRKSTELGCGVASCQNGQLKTDIWICNYGPAGNFVGQAPY